MENAAPEEAVAALPAQKAKRRRLRKNLFEAVVQIYNPTIPFHQLEQLLMNCYKEHAQVNTFRRPDDKLDMKEIRLSATLIKDTDEELRAALSIYVEHYTVIRYDYAALRDQLILAIGGRSAAVVVTPSSEAAYNTLLHYNAESEAVEEVKQFYKPSPAPMAAPRAIATKPQPEGYSFAGILEPMKLGAAMLFGLLIGSKMGAGNAAAAAAAAPPTQFPTTNVAELAAPRASLRLSSYGTQLNL